MKEKILAFLKDYANDLEKIHHGSISVKIIDRKLEQLTYTVEIRPDKPVSSKSVKYTNIWKIEDWLEKRKEEYKLDNCIVTFIIKNWSIAYVDVALRENNPIK